MPRCSHTIMRKYVAALTAWFPAASEVHPSEIHSRRRLLVSVAAVLILFAWPLYELLAMALRSSLYSHLPLIPIISAYLLHQRGITLRFQTRMRGASALPAAAASAFLLAFWFATRFGPLGLPADDGLALATLGFVLALWALALAFLTRETQSACLGPLGFLLFLIPLPAELLDQVETWLQHGSAVAAGMLFSLSNTPVYHEGLVFQLPGISLQVAPECSGIRSSLVLFITSLLAGMLFLDKSWKTALLAGAVLPLALLRNGFRIFVIGELCARIGPEMVHSWIHRHGGPVFFVLSLIPLFALLWLLMRLKPVKETSRWKRGA